MTLEEYDPEVFKTFVAWLYSLRSGDCYQWRPDLEPWKHCMIYCGLDIFADKIGSKKLREYAWECYQECVENCDHVQFQDHVKEIEMVFEKSPTDSPFRSDLIYGVVGEYLSPRFNNFKRWGEIMACSGAFSEEFAQELKDHMALPACGCQFPACSVHEKGPNTVAAF